MLGNKNESSSPINLDASLDVSKRVLTEPPSIVMILGRDAPPRGVRKQPSNGEKVISARCLLTRPLCAFASKDCQ